MKKNKGNIFINMNWFIPIMVSFINPGLGILLIIIKLFSIRFEQNEERRRKEKARNLRNKYSGGSVNTEDSLYERMSLFDDSDDLLKQESDDISIDDAVIMESQKKELKKRKILTVILFIIGGIAACYGLNYIGELIDSLLYSYFSSYVIRHELIPGLAGIATSIGCIKWGINLRHDLKDEELLRVIVGKKNYDSLTRISKVSGFSMKKVKRLLKDAISHGLFGSDAYIDMSNDTLFIRGEFPEESSPFSKVQNENVSSKDMDTPIGAESHEIASDVHFEEDEYQKILREFHEINLAIPGEEMTSKISELEELCARIFEIAKNNENKKAMLGRFMDYYLPTSKKLLSTYATLDKQGYEGANIKEAKLSIEENMDALVEAFRLQLDKLFEADAVDISTDIATLNKMFDMDGISESDFTLTK